ncbi:MAG: hypothetical protein IT310_01205 [Anaerolineales bacterium]|nr:hypothetical protein [Anaerolineales bacterium]
MKTSTPKKTLAVLIFFGFLYFCAFWTPNAQGARDLYMLSVFAPDEFAQYPYVEQMLNQPAGSTLQSIYRFIQYKHYYYGFPFYWLSSVFGLIPLRLLGYKDIALDLLFLRQMTSVLPMLLSVGLLVYMQTRFENLFHSVFLFLFLLTIPMTLINNLWWHPESLVLLFVVLTLFFLQKDNFAYKRDFYFSAIACGLATATKLLGLFFFLAILAYLLVGWLQKRFDLKKCALLGTSFIVLMAGSFLVSNPFLVFKSERDLAFQVQLGQSAATATGFIFTSARNPSLWLPTIEEYYAQPAFLGLIVLALFLAILNREKRLINSLIFLWSAAFGIYLLFFVALRHRYYFLPVMLPLFSALPAVFDKSIFDALKQSWMKPMRWLFIFLTALTLGVQILYNLQYDRQAYIEAWHKEANSASLAFFTLIDDQYLSKISLNRQLIIYRSTRAYIADEPRWVVKDRWMPVSYAYIERVRPDVIVLWKQEVLDYTNSDAIEQTTLSASLQKALPFYKDARSGSLNGYTLIYQDEFGMLFIATPLARVYLD